MAESNHDDLADALARLAGGDDAPSEQEPPAPVTPPASSAPVRPAAKPAARAVKPASSRPVAPKAAASAAPAVSAPTASVARPVAPKLASTPDTLANAAAGATTPRPPAPIAPSPPVARAPRPAGADPVDKQATSPVIRPAAPIARKARPAAPTIALVQQPSSADSGDDDGGQSTGITGETDPGTIIDDDDAVIVPAPDASVFRHLPKNMADFRAKKAAKASLAMRRTLIPILLTCSVSLAFFATLRFFVGTDSTMAPYLSATWLTLMLLGGAAFLLVLAILNMISVHKQMTTMKK